jgi:hypothetical protein
MMMFQEGYASGILVQDADTMPEGPDSDVRSYPDGHEPDCYETEPVTLRCPSPFPVAQYHYGH